MSTASTRQPAPADDSEGLLAPLPVVAQGAMVVRLKQALGRSMLADAPRSFLAAGRVSRQVLAVVAGANPRLVALVEEAEGPSAAARLAAAGMRLLSRCRVPVLLLPAGLACSRAGRVVVAAPSGRQPSDRGADALAQVLEPRGRDVIVLSVARPFRPPWCRVAPAMRGEQSKALREVWSEQASQAADEARALAGRLAAAGCTPIYLGAAGCLAREVEHVGAAGATALVCLMAGGRRFGRPAASEVCDVLRGTGVPVLLVPVPGPRIP